MGQWENFQPWDGHEGGSGGPRRLPPVTPIAPLYTFSKFDDFSRRHRVGTETEFQYESLAVSKFNRAGHKFKAWSIMKLRRRRNGGDELDDLLVFVKPGEHDAMLPREDETCEIDIIGVSRGRQLLATRRENPCSSWKVRHDFWERCLVFEVTLPCQGTKDFEPCFHGPQCVQNLRNAGAMPEPLSGTCKMVEFQLRLSISTRDAELDALNTLAKRTVTESQLRAFQFTLSFQAPKRLVSLFGLFPHMRDPILRPENVPDKLVERFRSLDAMQMKAYKGFLSNIPDGVCILPGGPGAGKTHFNLTVAASLLLKNEVVPPGKTATQPFHNKVLIMLDINKPSIDTANKMHQLCRASGLNKLVIRMYCWSYEKTSIKRGKLEAEREEIIRGISQGNSKDGKQPGEDDSPLTRYDADNDKTDNIAIHKFSGTFQKARESILMNAGLEDCVAPTLDQAARRWYEEHKETKYADLKLLLENIKDVRRHDVLEYEIEMVYRAVLQAADVVIATPVTASKFSDCFKSHFQPSLVVFDEAPHARELSTLIAMANFNPVAWMFTGDHRQTKPWVGSHGKKPAINKYVEQLRVSMMQRAYIKNPDMFSLLINHRAHGNLQALGSKLFYQGKMIPAKDPNEPGAIPPSALHLRQQYIMPLKGQTGPGVSRLLVILEGAGSPENVQQSWYHPKHQQWAMNLVHKLLKDPQFLQTNGIDPGTILIMSPYKQSFLEYRKAIKEFKKEHPDHEKRVVEPRTVGTAQGHEADFVILDLVRDWVTDHLEDPNRLCVSVTRARQAEIILMHEEMRHKLQTMTKFSSGPLAKMLSLCIEAGEYVSGPTWQLSARLSNLSSAQVTTARSEEPAAQSSEASQNHNDQLENGMEKLLLN